MGTYLNTIFAGRKILDQYKDYLKKGCYCCKAGSKLIYYHSKMSKDKDLLSFNDRSFAKRSPIVSMITKILLYSKGTGTGSMAMLTVNGDIKIFDYEKGIVITDCKDPSKAQKVKKSIEYYSPYFKIPNIFRETKKNQIVEEIIRSNECVPEAKYYAFRKFAEQYIFYFKSLKREDKTKIDWNQLLSEIPGDVKERLLDISVEIKKNLIQVRIHGDGHFDNLIIGKDNLVYVIDWETERRDWFLYDWFNYCYVDYLNYHSFDMFDKYFSGEIDDLIVEAFKTMGLNYNSRKKMEILKVFFAFRARFDQSGGHKIKGCQKIIEHYTSNVI